VRGLQYGFVMRDNGFPAMRRRWYTTVHLLHQAFGPFRRTHRTQGTSMDVALSRRYKVQRSRKNPGHRFGSLETMAAIHRNTHRRLFYQDRMQALMLNREE
ncbi:MAG: hypothetical protein MMC33_009316, partial [Icmadophila ericetorum]|nr:hypothetical protein [Icmadophila ericetorum]